MIRGVSRSTFNQFEGPVDSKWSTEKLDAGTSVNSSPNEGQYLPLKPHSPVQEEQSKLQTVKEMNEKTVKNMEKLNTNRTGSGLTADSLKFEDLKKMPEGELNITKELT
jgi:hypothetical protein